MGREGVWSATSPSRESKRARGAVDVRWDPLCLELLRGEGKGRGRLSFHLCTKDPTTIGSSAISKKATEVDQVGLCGRGKKNRVLGEWSHQQKYHILLERKEWVDFYRQGKSFMDLDAGNAADQACAHTGAMPRLNSGDGRSFLNNVRSERIKRLREDSLAFEDRLIRWMRPPRLRTALMNFFCKKTFACRSSSNACAAASLSG